MQTDMMQESCSKFVWHLNQWHNIVSQHDGRKDPGLSKKKNHVPEVNYSISLSILRPNLPFHLAAYHTRCNSHNQRSFILFKNGHRSHKTTNLIALVFQQEGLPRTVPLHFSWACALSCDSGHSALAGLLTLTGLPQLRRSSLLMHVQSSDWTPTQKHIE